MTSTNQNTWIFRYRISRIQLYCNSTN